MSHRLTGISFDDFSLEQALASFRSHRPDWICKGLPPSYQGTFDGVGMAGFSLMAGNLPLPVALLRQDAIGQNRSWMKQFLANSGVQIAPHGKTSMAPEILAMQLRDGAWGLTAATAQQVSFFAKIGVRRIILANQLVGAENISIVLDALEQYPDLTFYCIVDSVKNADQLADFARNRGALTLNILLEIGVTGGRTGTRGIEQALAVAEHVRDCQPYLALAGIEAYEGIVPGLNQEEREGSVRTMLEELRSIASLCEQKDLFAADEIILTAGGTEFFDMAAALQASIRNRKITIVIRSGCYITHDSVAYEKAYRRIVDRSEEARRIDYPLTAALEVWGAIQSRPEADLAFATLGKRDVSHDWDMPVPLKWFRPGHMDRPEPISPEHRVVKLNDQHAYLTLPKNSPLDIGDLVGFGVSHVCTTFDKWRALLVVDEGYRVTSAVRTFF